MKETKTPLEKAVLYEVLPIIAYIALFPMLNIILASFRTNKEIFEYALPFTWKTLIPQNWTMDNYMAIFRIDEPSKTVYVVTIQYQGRNL